MIKKKRFTKLIALLMLAMFILPMSFLLYKYNMANNTSKNEAITPKSAEDTTPVFFEDFNNDTIGNVPTGWSATGIDPSKNMLFQVYAGGGHNPFPTNALYIANNQAGDSIEGHCILPGYVTEGVFAFNVSAIVSDHLDTNIFLQDKSGNNLIKIQLKSVSSSTWEYIIGNYKSSTFPNHEIVNLKILFSYGVLELNQNMSWMGRSVEYTRGVIHQIEILSTKQSYGSEVFIDNLNLNSTDTHLVSSQNFAGDQIGKVPPGWNAVGADPSNNMFFQVNASGGQNPFTTSALFIGDNQNSSHIYAAYPLYYEATNGVFEFNVSASVSDNLDTYIILQDNNENNLTKVELKSASTSSWEYIIGSYTSSVFTNKEIVSLKLEFIGNSLNVYQNSNLVASNLPYTTGLIHHICVKSTLMSNGNEVFIDHFNLYTYPNWFPAETGFIMNALADQQTLNYNNHSYDITTGFNVLMPLLSDIWGNTKYETEMCFTSSAQISGSDFNETYPSISTSEYYYHWIRIRTTSMSVAVQYPTGDYMDIWYLISPGCSHWVNNDYFDSFQHLYSSKLTSGFNLYSTGHAFNVTWHSGEEPSSWKNPPDGASKDLNLTLYLNPPFTNANDGNYTVTVSYSYEIVDFCQCEIPGLLSTSWNQQIIDLGTITHTSVFQINFDL